MSGLGPVPPLGKRWQVQTSFFVIDTPAFSATLTTFAKTSSPGSSTPLILTFSLRQYCSMLSASMTGDRFPAAEYWIFLSSSRAQKPQRKGLEKKFLGINIGTQMLVQMTQPLLPSIPGPVHSTR